MNRQKRIFFTVTNDLNYDQRMIRICGSLAHQGYSVTLVGRKLRGSPPLLPQPFRQKRLYCFFSKGKFFYAEYNLRLFLYLLLKRMDAICAIDLDAILPCYFISLWKRIPRIYDAHELFCEMQEIVDRPEIYTLWKKIERFAVPKFIHGYTVNQPIADEFQRMYGLNYEVIRNMPLSKSLTIPVKSEKYLLYQGAVNEGRCFETLVPAMLEVDVPLVICGDGNFITQTRELVKRYGLEEKIIFKGKMLPADLYRQTLGAWAGITLFENRGLSNYYSLANRFFDYMQAGIPQLCVDYPVYRQINNEYPFALLISEPTVSEISAALNRLLRDETLYHVLQQNCIKVRAVLNWEAEEKILIDFYSKILNPVG